MGNETPNTKVLRLIDASLNRATEGARVVEDYVRFVLDDRLLTESAKRLRHAIAQLGEGFASPALGRLTWSDRVAMRDTPDDVGTKFTTDSERTRSSVFDVCIASLERTQQALRSLEEYAKTLPDAPASQFERLRYDVYCLAKSIAACERGAEKLAGVQLYVLIDGRESLNAFQERVTTLCDAGVHALQLRDKRASDRKLLALARAMVNATSGYETLAIINDRPDIARLSQADGVHVGQEEFTVSEARTFLGPRGLVGVSTHCLPDLEAAIDAGADYVGLGPTFASTTKSFEHFPGTAYLEEAARATSLPAFAIGGVNLENLEEVLATGVKRVAVSAAVTEAADPAEMVGRLLRRLGVG